MEELTKILDSLKENMDSDVKDIRGLANAMREIADVYDEIADIMENDADVSEEDLSTLLGKFMLGAIKMNKITGGEMDFKSLFGGK